MAEKGSPLMPKATVLSDDSPTLVDDQPSESSDAQSITVTVGRHKVVLRQLNGFESMRVTRMTPAEWITSLATHRALSAVREIDGRKHQFPQSIRQIEALAASFTESESDKLVVSYLEAFSERVDGAELKNA